MMGMRRFLAVALLIVAVGLVTTVSLAANMSPAEGVQAQWKAALDMSKKAQTMSAMTDVKMQMQGVINCVEGGKSPLYDGSAGDNCAKMGNGMVNDAKMAGGKYMAATAWFEMARDTATMGKSATAMDKAKAAAWTTQIVLEHAGALLK
jgi:hypothetical protein